jgi:[protein-PII] uridylyltransferase
LTAPDLRGRAFVEAHTDATDQWFRELADRVLDDLDGIALLAVGGYGRRELSPRSDIDVVLVHDDSVDGAEVAESLWYPVWDRGLKMGYVVVTPAQAKALLREEFEWATAFLDTRLVTGEAALKEEIDRLTATVWADRGDHWLEHMAATVKTRHSQRGDAAFQIEPHLKEGRGGLRDVHALGWAERVEPGFASDFLSQLRPDVDTLLEARVELHRLTDRAGDILTLDEQDGVAEALGDANSNELMLRLAQAARRIAWCSDEAWSRWSRARASSLSITASAPPMSIASPAVPDTTQLLVTDGLIAIRDGVEVADDPLLLLRMAALAAETGLVMDRDSLAAVAAEGPPLDEPWPREARRLFTAIFLAGRSAIPVVEDLDQFGLMPRLIPEWSNVLCHPQRNVMHTFTVDRHLCEAAANASALVDRVQRPDLLVIGALLHDIGKGFPGDHTEVGMEIIAEIGQRMGFAPNDVAILVDLCRHHLLLPDIATRRDVADPGTIRAVAAAVDSVFFLEHLAALTEADSIATGPSAWGSWKEGLLRQLVSRTAHLLDGGSLDDVTPAGFPTDAVRADMAKGKRRLIGAGTTFTVIEPERRGLFSTMAGVLAVSGLEVLDAAAYSEDLVVGLERPPMAACQFHLQPPQNGTVDWDRVIGVAERALDRRLALQARVGRRAREQNRYRRRLAAGPPRREVIIDNDISDTATVVEVHAPDEIGLLYRLTQVLLELRLDIRTAKVQTLGPQVVDSFYVRDREGAKALDPDLVGELRLALTEAIT